MKTYTIEISLYPQEFIVTAESEAEAVAMAQKRFYDNNGTKSIYTTEVLEAREIGDLIK